MDGGVGTKVPGNISLWYWASVLLLQGAKCCQGRRMPVGHAVIGVGSQWRPRPAWAGGEPAELPRVGRPVALAPHGPRWLDSEERGWGATLPWLVAAGGWRSVPVASLWVCLGTGIPSPCFPSLPPWQTFGSVVPPPQKKTI